MIEIMPELVGVNGVSSFRFTIEMRNTDSNADGYSISTLAGLASYPGLPSQMFSQRFFPRLRKKTVIGGLGTRLGKAT